MIFTTDVCEEMQRQEVFFYQFATRMKILVITGVYKSIKGHVPVSLTFITIWFLLQLL